MANPERSYREIFYGLAFGAGAWLIDVAMHSWSEGSNFGSELFPLNAPVLVSRFLFLVLGGLLGYALWRSSRKERDYRHLEDLFRSFQRKMRGPTTMIYTKLQLLLAHHDFSLPPAAAEIARSIYQESQRLQAALNEHTSEP